MSRMIWRRGREPATIPLSARFSSCLRALFRLNFRTRLGKTYLEYLPKVRQTKSTYEYYLVLQQVRALLRDGHTKVYLPKELCEEMAARPPLRTALVEGKVIVECVLSPTLERQGIKSGAEIIRLDGMPVTEYAEKFVQPFQSSSTAQDLNVRTCAYLIPIQIE